jgi:biopolymer transport protein ExbD
MSFDFDEGDNDDVVSEINMTPLVDVMLVLLIIFIIITVPVLTHSVKIDLPRATNQVNQVKPKTITISVTQEGQFYWDKELLNKEQLVTHLQQVAAQQPQPVVHIRGDKKVNYEYVMTVMAEAQRSGVQQLGFITEPSS